MRLIVNLALGLLTLAYPVGVYFGLRHVEPWKIAAALIVLLAARHLAVARRTPANGWVVLAGGLFCVLAIWRNDALTLRFYPVVVNAAMLALFGWTLLNPPTAIERLARLQHPDLPPSGIAYTRRVTQVWCGFFVLNGGAALFTALCSSFEVWSLYNGLIAYILMGLLFAGEYWVRIKTQRHAD